MKNNVYVDYELELKAVKKETIKLKCKNIDKTHDIFDVIGNGKKTKLHFSKYHLIAFLSKRKLFGKFVYKIMRIKMGIK